MQGLRTRGTLQNVDCAELARKAKIARDSMGNWPDPDELLAQDEARSAMRMLAGALLAAALVGLALLAYFMPAIVRWMVLG